MSPPIPRPYQQELIDGARQAFREGHRCVLLVSSTGSGKSVVIGAIVKGLSDNSKDVLVLAHRSRLIKQLLQTMRRFGVVSMWIKGTAKLKYFARLGMVETIRRRLKKLPAPKYIIIDEAHHSLSEQYLEIIKYYPNARVIGLSATPERTDGKGLGEVYTTMIEGPPMRWFIDNGYLADYLYIEPEASIDLSKVKKDAKTGDVNVKAMAKEIRHKHLAGDAIESYQKYLDGKTGIVFCSGIEHAEETAQEFTRAGILCKAIHGGMGDDEQDLLMGELERKEIMLLASADLIGEGVDIPSINGVIMLRYTESIVIFLQQAGRALRLKEDGSKAVIIDHVQNRRKHGLPCDPRKWSLEGKSKREGELKTRTCGECFRVFNASDIKEQAAGCANSQCPILQGLPPIVTEMVVNVVPAEMVEVKVADAWAWANGIDPVLASGPEWKALIALADNEEKLKMIQRARGFNHRWVHHQMVAKGLKSETRSFSKYTKVG